MTRHHPAPSDRRKETTTPKQTESSQSSELLPDVGKSSAATETLSRLLDACNSRLNDLSERLKAVEDRLESMLYGPRISSHVTDVRKSEYARPIPKSAEHIVSRAVRLTVELAEVLQALDIIEDELTCRFKESIVEQLARVVGLEVGE